MSHVLKLCDNEALIFKQDNCLSTTCTTWRLTRWSYDKITRHNQWSVEEWNRPSIYSEDWADTSANATDPSYFVQIQHIQHQWPTNEYPHGTFTCFKSILTHFTILGRCTLLFLIDEPVRLLKRRPILHTGSFVVVRFVFFIFTGRPESPTAGWAWCIWAIIVPHSSVGVNSNSLLECGPRIRYM